MRKQAAVQAALAATLAIGGAATACAAPALPDDAGQVRQQAQAREEARVQRADRPSVPAAGGSFLLKDLQVELTDGMSANLRGIEKIRAACLGRQVTLRELQQAATEMTRYFRRHGYPAATAYLPPQQSADGTIRIAILPGRLGAVRVENQSKLATGSIEMLARGLRRGQIITAKRLETVLYNINGAGGVKAGGLLSPGAKQGESDLVIKVEDGKVERYVLYTENHGSKEAGRYRHGLVADWYELAKRGDHLGANVMFSSHDQKNYGVNYDLLTGRSGTRLGLGLSRSNYELAAQLSQLGATGKALTASLYGSTPLYRTSGGGLGLSYGYDYRDLKDELRSAAYVNERHNHAFHLGLNGFTRSKRDVMSYSVTGYKGNVSTDRLRFAGAALPGNLVAHGSYGKGVANFSLTHDLGVRLAAGLRFTGQRASNRLDSSEQMYIGGANAVRDYPQGEGSGEDGYQATAELRYRTKCPGLSFAAFFDCGHSRNRSTESGTTLKGWGIGMNFSRAEDFFLRLDYARRIGLPENASDAAKAKQRIWFMAGKVW